MRRHSLSRRLISSVLLVELVFAVAVIALAAAYERHAHLRSFDIMLQGRADSLLGAVQDAEDPADNVMLDRTGLQLPSEDVYEVRDSNGRLLGRSSNWQGPDPHDVAAGEDRIYGTRINGHHYRVLALHGMRVVDPGDKGGGMPRHILVVYGARTAQVWHQVRNAIVFFSLSNLVLLLVTGVLMAWLLHRGLAPMRQLAAEAENISIHRWSFQPPESAVETRELAPLASALTAAMQRLEASFSQQRRFVSDAAHELKTAVAVVKSSLQLLAMRQRTTEEYEAGVEVSLADCERMEDIVARMLTLARAEHSSRRRAVLRHLRPRSLCRSNHAAVSVHGGGPLRQARAGGSRADLRLLVERGMRAALLQPAVERVAAQPAADTGQSAAAARDGLGRVTY